MYDCVETILEDERWEEAGLEALAARVLPAALRHLGLSPEGFEIALLGCDDARIAVLNEDFREKPRPTNVLSWPAGPWAPPAPGAHPPRPVPGPSEMPEALGDIAIAWETCAREAREAGKPLTDHVTHLLVHALLHLLGYDHINDADAALMEGLEAEILATMGLADPYE